MKLDRRNFLQLGLGAVAGFMATPINWKFMDDSAIWTQNWSWVPVVKDGARAFANTTCQVCGGGCGLKVRLIDEKRAVSIDGSPESPLNRGGVCAWGAAGLQYQYLDDNRVKGPVRKDKVTGAWIPITWPEALKILAAELKKYSGKKDRVALISGRGRSTMDALMGQFMAAYGSPNYIRPDDSAAVQEAASKLLFGQPLRYGFDLEGTELVLSFGAALLEGYASPARMNKAFGGSWDPARPGSRLKIIQVEPRSSQTASKAQLWLAAKPGTEAELALGIGAAMITGNMVAESAQAAPGFDELKSFLAAYTPVKTSQATGIDPERIEAAAKLFAGTEKAVALSGQGQGSLREPVALAWATLILNILKGNVGQSGGLYFTPPAPGFETPASDKAPSLAEWAKKIASGKAQAGLVMLYEANPRYTAAGTEEVGRALDAAGMVVSFSPYWDETTSRADLILPDLAGLERWDDIETPLGLPYQAVSFSKPLFTPRFKGLPFGDVLIRTAQAFKGDKGEALQAESFEALIAARVEMLAETGSAGGEELPEMAELASAGPGEGADGEAIMASGVWYSAVEGGLPEGLNLANKPKVGPVTPVGEERLFPLQLVAFDTLRIASGFYANPPFVTKIMEDDLLLGQDMFVNINPKDAAKLHLGEDDRAVLQTPTGQGVVRIHLTEGAMPGVVFLPSGMGHKTFDPTIKGKGVNSAKMVPSVEDPNGGPLSFVARAKLRKA